MRGRTNLMRTGTNILIPKNSGGNIPQKSIWSEGTDEELITMLESYYNGDINIRDYCSVGDVRSISLGYMSSDIAKEIHDAKIYEFVIIGIEHDDLSMYEFNGKTKAAITVQMKDVLDNYGYMNNNVNNTGGWKDCIRRTWCNNTFYNAIPSKIRNVIKDVNKKTKIETSNVVSVNSDLCFLLSPIEIGLNKGNEEGYKNEGNTYEYYETLSNRIKYNNNTPVEWWERSPTGSVGFCCVTKYGSSTTSGGLDAGYSAKTNLYLSVAFCL